MAKTVTLVVDDSVRDLLERTQRAIAEKNRQGVLNGDFVGEDNSFRKIVELGIVLAARKYGVLDVVA